MRKPDGSAALVAIGRDRERRTGWWRGPWDDLRDAAFVVRRVRGDRSWRIELYAGVDDDVGGLPARPPDRTWVVPSHEAAVAGAEALSGRLARGEPTGI